jgi:thiol-disulfide isomerase/thioredoxin
MRLFVLLLALCGALAGPLLTALDIGEPAPPLAGVTWVKGDAVKPSGTITVVEFWATWCGPCRESIPHLTALQKRFGAKVQIAGLSNEDAPTVKPFVEKMGTKMDYHVGIADERTYGSYMEGIDGIPYSFLIDATGKVVWQGHPASLEGPLDQLVAGKFDAALQQRLGKALKELQSLLGGRNPDVEKATAKVDEILALDAVNEQAIDVRMAIGNFLKKPEMVRETLARIPIDQLSAAQANSLAWARVTDETLANRNLDLAQRFLQRAQALEPQNAAYLDTQARLLYLIGRLDDAIAIQERAIKLEPGDQALAATLAYYRQARDLGQHPDTVPAAPAPAKPAVSTPP